MSRNEKIPNKNATSSSRKWLGTNLHFDLHKEQEVNIRMSGEGIVELRDAGANRPADSQALIPLRSRKVVLFSGSDQLPFALNPLPSTMYLQTSHDHILWKIRQCVGMELDPVSSCSA